MDITYLQNILKHLSSLVPSQYREAEKSKIHTVEAFKQLFPDEKDLIQSINKLKFTPALGILNGFHADLFNDSRSNLASIIAAKIEVLKRIPIKNAVHDLEQNTQLIKQHEHTIEQYRVELQKADERLIAAGKIQSEQDKKIHTLQEEVKKQGLITKWKNRISIPIVLSLVGGIFWAGWYAGNTKYDKDKIDLSETNIVLKDSLKLYRKGIDYLRMSSDSAHQILGHMPYNEMSLDTAQHHKVQSTIENAGHILYLNKNYKIK